jgi:hypothetical protein
MAAGRLKSSLLAEFGQDRVFQDVVMAPGTEFPARLQHELDRALVLLVLIGDNWLRADDGSLFGRINDPLDWVRNEISTCLAAQILVVPILINTAEAPAEVQLPDDIAPLARKQHHRLSSDRWEHDLAPLIDLIREHADWPQSSNLENETTDPASEDLIDIDSAGHRARPRAGTIQGIVLAFACFLGALIAERVQESIVPVVATAAFGALFAAPVVEQLNSPTFRQRASGYVGSRIAWLAGPVAWIGRLVPAVEPGPPLFRLIMLLVYLLTASTGVLVGQQIGEETTQLPTIGVNNVADVHTQKISSLTIEPELDLLISSDESGRVAVWSTSGNGLLKTLEAGSNVRSTDISRSAEYLAVNSQSSTVIYSVSDDWSFVTEVPCSWCYVYWVDDDQSLITIGLTDIRYWSFDREAGSFRELRTVEVPGQIDAVAMGSDRQEFVLGIQNIGEEATAGARLERWRIVEGIPELVETIGEPRDIPWSIVLSPDESELATTGIGGGNLTQIWRVAEGGDPISIDTTSRESGALAWPEEDALFTGFGDRIEKWDLNPIGELPANGFQHGQDGGLVIMRWDKLRTTLYTAHDSGEICAWPAAGDWIETTCVRVD